MIVAFPAASLLLVTATLAEHDPAQPCLSQTATTIEAISHNNHPRILAFIAELQMDLKRLEARRDRALRSNMILKRRQQDVESRIREKAYSKPALDIDAGQLEAEWDVWSRAAVEHNGFAEQHKKECGLVTPEEYFRCRAIDDQVNRNKEYLERKREELRDRDAAIAQRRNTLGSGLMADLADAGRLAEERASNDKLTAQLITDCVTLAQRARGLRTVAAGTLPKEPTESDDALGESLATELTKGVAEAGAVTALERTAARRLVVLGLRKTWIGYAYTVGDVSLDVATTAADQQTLEVERSIMLVGDYTAAMKRIVDRKNRTAADRDALKAIQSELRLRQQSFPSTGTEVVARGLVTPEAATQALIGLVAAFSSAYAAEAGSKMVNHFNNAQRKALGKGGVVLFREAVSSFADGATGVEVSRGAERIAAALRDARANTQLTIKDQR